MAAQTIKAQVEELVGTTTLASLDDWAGEAYNRLVFLLPYEALLPFAVSQQCIYSGVYTELTATNKRIFEVLRFPSSGSLLVRTCEFLPAEEYRGRYSDTDSLYYPTDYDPKYTIYTDTIKVLPSVAGQIVRIRTIVLVDTYDTNKTAVVELPYPCEHLMVLDLAGRVALNKMQALALAALSVSTTVPTAPTAPVFVYTDAVKNTVVATMLGSLGSAPTYTKPTIGTLPSDLAIADLVLDTTVPSAPSLTTVSYSNASGSTVSAVTIGAIPDVPTYSPVVYPAEITTALGLFDTAMTSEDVELALPRIQQVSQHLERYRTEVQESLGSFQKNMEKFKADIQKVIEQSTLLEQEAQTNAKLTTDVALQNAIQTAEAILKNNTSLLQKYQAEVAAYGHSIEAQVSVFNTSVQKSVAQYQAVVRKVVDVYQTDIQNELNETNTQLANYRVTLEAVSKQLEATLQEALTNAKISADLEAKNREQQLAVQVQVYQAQLRKYETEIASYTAQVQKATSEYQMNLGRLNGERDRLLVLKKSFDEEYARSLALNFGISLKGSDNGKQG